MAVLPACTKHHHEALSHLLTTDLRIGGVLTASAVLRVEAAPPLFLEMPLQALDRWRTVECQSQGRSDEGRDYRADAAYGRRRTLRPELGSAMMLVVQEDAMAVGVTRSAGMLLLAIWLILTGLAGLVAFALPSVLMAALALIAGVLILVGR
jgi:hypothetical protein